MLRNAAREEIRNVAAPLWLLINSTSWPGNRGEFDIIKNGASTITAHLAYCAIGADEREQRNRAKVVPCRAFQDLLSGEQVDFTDVLRSMDFSDVEVVRTKFFVAVVISVRTFLLIGVRGTQFAYDWLINFKIAKEKGIGGEYFHAGLLREAQELAECLRNQYAKRLADSDFAIYLSGHSLGGAVAAILNQMQFAAPINACYMFGAPRISNLKNFYALYQPFATRRYLDIVPHCPPSTFNYADFANQKNPNGDPYVPAGGIELYFFASWLFDLALNQFPKNHSMERYRLEVLEVVKRHPRVQNYWRYPDLAP